MYAFIELFFGKIYWDKLMAQFQSKCYLIAINHFWTFKEQYPPGVDTVNLKKEQVPSYLCSWFYSKRTMFGFPSGCAKPGV